MIAVREADLGDDGMAYMKRSESLTVVQVIRGRTERWHKAKVKWINK
jgi:hypothetical protein